MQVSVVIPAYNEAQHITQCLQCLKEQIEPPDEIIVVDNNSTDNTAHIARSFGVKVIKEKKQGMTPARNRGFNEAKGDIIARTDSDSRVPPDWILRIKEHFKKDPFLLGLSGASHFYDASDIIQHKNWPTKLSHQASVKIMKHHGMYGPNMALRKSAWNMVKDEVCQDDRSIHEDIDLAIHLAKHGKVLFDDSLIVETSFRRWKKVKPYFEYPYRYLTTIEQHKRWMKRIKAKALSMRKTVRKYLRQTPRNKNPR